MEIALALVALLVVVLAGTALAERVGFPGPLLLVILGVAGGFLPHFPEVRLPSDVILLGLLPPLLYAAALQTSLVDFRANQKVIGLLSVGLVVFSMALVAVVARALLTDLSWPTAFAIGAVVAPPDAVAATTIGRRIGLPRRIVTILEGESLFNDATALVSLRTAIAAMGGGISLWQVGGDFVLAAVGGGVVGFAVFMAVGWVRKHITDPLMDTALSFVVPFVAYLGAEQAHASGVIAVVVAGLLLGHRAPVIQTAQSRLAERTNWRTIAFLLENTVFFLIGLQAHTLLQDVSHSTLGVGRIAAVCAATLATVIFARLVWVFAARFLLLEPGPERRRPTSEATLLLGWAGMRGVVTLAAALVLPQDTEHREILLLVAFTVVAGTLFLQGLSLPWLARRLDMPGPDAAEDALARATLLQQATKAGMHKLAECEAEEDPAVLDTIKQRIDQRNFAAWERLGTRADVESPSAAYARVRLTMLEAERDRVLEVRSSGRVPSEVVAEVLGMLDVEESMLNYGVEQREQIVASRASGSRGDDCPDLERYPTVETEPEPVCAVCVATGQRWVALRQCLECGNVACCDSSPGQHATAHFHDTAHPVMETAEPDEDWRWCYIHHVTG